MTGRTTARREVGEIPLLAAIFQGLPNLTGARCVGSAGLFDARERDEDHTDAAYRHAAAAQLCRTCPALEECRAWSDSQPDQARHVIAGRIPDTTTPGRPAKETAA